MWLENEGAGEKTGLYRFKDDRSNNRDVLNILKRDEREVGGPMPLSSKGNTGKYAPNGKTI